MWWDWRGSGGCGDRDRRGNEQRRDQGAKAEAEPNWVRRNPLRAREAPELHLPSLHPLTLCCEPSLPLPGNCICLLRTLCPFVVNPSSFTTAQGIRGKVGVARRGEGSIGFQRSLQNPLESSSGWSGPGGSFSKSTYAYEVALHDHPHYSRTHHPSRLPLHLRHRHRRGGWDPGCRPTGLCPGQ